MKNLLKERNELKKQVVTLANFNYAREPQYVRDRLDLTCILDEVSNLRKRINSKQITPLVTKLEKALEALEKDAYEYEVQSELLQQQFLEKSLDYASFNEQYVKIRKQACVKRKLADQLAKEKLRLQEGLQKKVSTNDPQLANVIAQSDNFRKERRVSFAE